MKIYKDTNGLVWFDNQILPQGSLGMSIDSDKLTIWDKDSRHIIFSGTVSQVTDANGDSYTTLDSLLSVCKDFFVKAPAAGGGSNPQIIDMLPGQYLSDILETITDASVDKPYTINFYNHSKTIDWSKFTQKIVWPRFVNLNFVGSINWWPFKYYPGMGFDEGLTDDNPTDKLFIGFDFNQQNEDNYIYQCGLPNLLNKIFFGGLDMNWQMADDYQTLDDNKDDYANDYLHLVWAGGNVEDDPRNRKLYKKLTDPSSTLVDVTPDFRMVDLSGCQLMGAYLFGANLGNAYLENANLWKAYLENANLENANLENANLWKAYLVNANLVNANLGNANLVNAYLVKANLVNAYLWNANLGNAYLGNANLVNAYLWNANLGNAYLDNANLVYAYLWKAYLGNANLGNANLVNAYLGNANLENIQVNNNTNFSGANLTGATNLPENLNTKAKFIAAVGVGNVNAETIWVDGTSILA